MLGFRDARAIAQTIAFLLVGCSGGQPPAASATTTTWAQVRERCEEQFSFEVIRSDLEADEDLVECGTLNASKAEPCSCPEQDLICNMGCANRYYRVLSACIMACKRGKDQGCTELSRELGEKSPDCARAISEYAQTSK